MSRDADASDAAVALHRLTNQAHFAFLLSSLGDLVVMPHDLPVDEMSSQYAIHVVMAVSGDDRCAILEAVRGVVEKQPRVLVAGVCEWPLPHGVVLTSLGASGESPLISTQGVNATVQLGPAPPDELCRRYRRLQLHLAAEGIQALDSPLLGDSRSELDQLLAGAGIDDIEGLLRRELGSLLAIPRGRAEPLLKTLAAFYETDGHLARTAAMLHMHPKGVSYRLKRIGAILGRDARGPHDTLLVQLALHLFRLHRLTLPPLGSPDWSAGR